MIHHSPLAILCIGLLFCSCDKPGSTQAEKDTSASDAPRKRGGHEPRHPRSSSTEVLRSALDEVTKIELPAERAKALADIAWSTLETDPDIAHEAFLKLPADSQEKIRLIQHYALCLAEQNYEDAIAWAETLGTELEIATAKYQIALSLAEDDPLRAANLLSESGVSGREFDVAVVQVIQRWAAKSAPDAAAWVSAFPPGPSRVAGITEISKKWLPSDPSAAFAWMGGLKDEESKAEAARAMQGILLQQPADVQKEWLEHADVDVRAELERQRAQALLDVGDNIPPQEE